MKARLSGLGIALALLLASAQAQEPNQQVTVAIVDDLVCITMLLPGEVPWHETLALFADAIDELTETFKETGTGYVPMDKYDQLKDAGIEASTGRVYSWGFRIGDMTAEQAAEVGPDPWAIYSPTNSLTPGALLPPKGTTPHPAVEMTLCTPLPQR